MPSSTGYAGFASARKQDMCPCRELLDTIAKLLAEKKLLRAGGMVKSGSLKTKKGKLMG